MCEKKVERGTKSQGETISGKVWKMALPSNDFSAELGVYRYCSREAGARAQIEARGNGGTVQQ